MDWETVDSFEVLSPYIEMSDFFICIHAGLPLDKENNILPLKEAPIEQLVNDRIFKEPYIIPKSENAYFLGTRL